MDHPKRQSLLANELANVIDTLQGLFDEIGLACHERESREANVYAALSATLQDQLRTVSQDKTKIADECRQLKSQIKQLQHSLGDIVDYDNDDEESSINVPLLKCLQGLKEKHKMVKKRHAERYDSIKKLALALETYASRLEPSIVQITLPPITNDLASVTNFDLSNDYYEQLEQEFTRVYQEFTRRGSAVSTLAKEIINLYAELGIPSAQADSTIVEYGMTEPERLGLTKGNIEQLKSKKAKLVDEKERRLINAEELKLEINELWTKLGVEENDKTAFLAQHRGCDMRTLQDLEDELHRLLDIKRENMHIFVENARLQLQELWDKLYFSEDEILDFSPVQSDVYTDALLTAHEMEISRLEALLDERASVLSLVSKHRELMDDKEQLALSATDASRLMSRGANGARDPSRLLREERMRKRLAKELPRIELELKKALEKWENDHGEPLLIKGENYLETLLRLSPIAPSRAATKTPTTTRGRANTTSVLNNYSQPRAKSKPNAKDTTSMRPPQRPKTPTARPKTPGAQLQSHYSGSSTVGRTIGKNLASTIGRTAPLVLGSTHLLGGGIPRPTSCNPQSSPTRMVNNANTTNRPALSSLYSIGIANERKDVSETPSLGRNASIKRKLGFGLEVAPKLQSIQSEAQATPYQRYHVQEGRREDEEMRSSRGGRSIRSISPEIQQYRTYSDGVEEELSSTPRVGTYRPKSMHELGYSSSRGSQTSVDSRQFSASTVSTVSCVSSPGNSGSENWETYGDDDSEYGDDTELDLRTAYYRDRLKHTYSSNNYSNAEKSVGLVRRGS